MHVKQFITAALPVGLLACGSDSPTGPVSTVPPPLVSPASPRLTGVVLDDRGAPIAGASVFAPTGTADETDDRGLFYVTSTAPNGAYFGLSVYKTGYEPQNLFVRGPTEVVTLHDIVRLPVGESIRITMGANESVDPDVEYRYRRVRIVSSTPTAVELSVTAADGGTPDWELEKGPCCPSPPTVVTSIDDVGVELVAWFRDSFWNPVHRTYTLSTRRVGQ